MSTLIKIENLEKLLVHVRGESVLLDADVATIYGIETKRVNEAVKNNPEKFPPSYMFVLSDVELTDLRSKFSTAKSAMTRVAPKAFTEKGLYMMATVLHSAQAVEATFAIIETFAKLRELSRNIKALSVVQDKADQKTLMQKSGELITEIFEDDLQTSETESSIELNFAVLKFKHTVKKKAK